MKILRELYIAMEFGCMHSNMKERGGNLEPNFLNGPVTLVVLR